METPIYKDLVRKIIEKEQRDVANAKKLKESEASIKIEEENIKKLQSLKRKMKEELENKLLENSKVRIKKNILQQQHLIWTDLLKNTQNNLKEEEAKLESLQQSICLNRLSFCDSTREFIEKIDVLEANHGFYKEHYPSTKPNIVCKKEETDEYNNLFEKKIHLEEELEQLKHKEAQIEEAKQLKMKLQAEPSGGEHFIRLQKSIKDIKDELANVEIQIRIVKDDIAKKELQLLSKENTTGTKHHLCTDKYEEDLKTKQNERNIHQGDSITSSTKTVHFSNFAVAKESPSSPKFIIKNFLASQGHQSLSRELSQQLTSKLDEEMKGILFKNSN